MTVLPNGKDIVNIKVGDSGSTSDISQFRARLSEFSPFQKFKGDKGYLGKEKPIYTPHKNPKNGESTETPKKLNKQFSANRL